VALCMQHTIEVHVEDGDDELHKSYRIMTASLMNLTLPLDPSEPPVDRITQYLTKITTNKQPKIITIKPHRKDGHIQQ